MNITVVGIGYVGLSNAILLAQNNNVIALDIDEDRIKLLNSKKTPISFNFLRLSFIELIKHSKENIC